MAQSSSDREIVDRLQQRIPLWQRRRDTLNYQYDAEGRLISIDLDNLDLSDVPRELWQLSNLQGLYLSNNLLSALPVEVGQLSNLRWLDLSGNPLTVPPPEIVEQGTPAVLAYLRELRKPGVELYEAKIILVGEARMGKSSLAASVAGLAV